MSVADEAATCDPCENANPSAMKYKIFAVSFIACRKL